MLASGVMSETTESRSERVDLRMTPSAKRALAKAARRDEQVADGVLARQRIGRRIVRSPTVGVQLDQVRWDAFMAALVAPPKDNIRLRRLLARKPAWDR